MSDSNKSLLARRGPLVALLGVLILIGVLAYSGYAVSTSLNELACDDETQQAFFKNLKENDALRGETLVVLPIGENPTFELPGSLCVALNPAKYFKEERAKPDGAKTKSLTLFLDDENTQLTKIVPVGTGDQWQFLEWKLRDTAASAKKASGGAAQDVWKEILSGVDLATGRRSLSIGLGDAQQGGAPPAIAKQKAELIAYDPLLVLLGALGLLLVGAGLIASNSDTGLLRDGAGKVIDAARPSGFYLTAYSLSKTQIGLWSLLSIGGFILLWVVTGRSSDIMTPEMLTLLGIQGSSGLAAVIIQNDQPPPRPSESFLADILSDGVSVSLHRVQMFGWTLILAGIFLWSVFSTLSFPKFDTNLLILSGLANSLYIGSKWPEAKAAERAAATKAAAAPHDPPGGDPPAG